MKRDDLMLPIRFDDKPIHCLPIYTGVRLMPFQFRARQTESSGSATATLLSYPDGDFVRNLDMKVYRIAGIVYFLYDGELHVDVPYGNYFIMIIDGTYQYYSVPLAVCNMSKFLGFQFSSQCPMMGSIYYGTNQNFRMYIDGDVEQMYFEETDEGQEDGEGNFVPTLRRQIKKYKIITQEQPPHMVDAFYRMRMNDHIYLTWKDGDITEIYNVQVEHEWFAEKYNAIVTLTFDLDEKCIVDSCCRSVVAVDITEEGFEFGEATADSTTVTADTTVISADQD